MKPISTLTMLISVLLAAGCGQQGATIDEGELGTFESLEGDLIGGVQKGIVPDAPWGYAKNSDFDRQKQFLIDTRTKWVRLHFAWNQAETSDNVYSAQTLGLWDRSVTDARAAGASIVAMVFRSPQWASGSTNMEAPPRDPAKFREFMQFISARYRGRILYWEVWNEQNTVRFWPPAVNAAQYVTLLKQANLGIKSGCPECKTLFGGTSQNDYSYISSAYAAGAKGHFDIMATHPYPFARPPENADLDSAGNIAKGTFPGFRSVRIVMDCYGESAKPIWFTEFGWSTCSSTACVSQANQAAYLKRAYAYLAAYPYVQVAIWYNLRNWRSDVDSFDPQLGLMSSNYTPKPAYYAYRDVP
jgi:polysaccharide biosynthesis protein PslG